MPSDGKRISKARAAGPGRLRDHRDGQNDRATHISGPLTQVFPPPIPNTRMTTEQFVGVLVLVALLVFTLTFVVVFLLS